MDRHELLKAGLITVGAAFFLNLAYGPRSSSRQIRSSSESPRVIPGLTALSYGHGLLPIP